MTEDKGGNRIRVALMGTGDVGHYALRGIITRPDLELVGVRVWSDSKVGRDAGELIGWDAVGVPATKNTAEILAAQPDCIVQVGPSRILEPVVEPLAAGANVVTLGDAGLVHPPSWQHQLRGAVETACRMGNSSLFYGGIDAGFASHTMPIVLSGICESVSLMTVYEVRDYDPLPKHQLDWFNFGRESKEGARFDNPGGITHVWGPSLRLIAQALGVTLDRIEEFFETAPAPETFDIPAMTIGQGTIAAVRFGISGFVDGVERLRVEHVNRLRRDIAPEWQHDEGYGVRVQGQPNYRMHLDLADPVGIQTRPALWGTAMYLVNAIPHVVAAKSGIVSVLDLPYITSAAFRSETPRDNWTLSRRITEGRTEDRR